MFLTSLLLVILCYRINANLDGSDLWRDLAKVDLSEPESAEVLRI